MSLFPSVIDQDLFYAVYLGWFGFTFFIERMMIGSGQADRTKRREDKSSYILIFLSVFVSIAVAYGFAEAGIAILPDWLFAPGIGLMLLGILVREWAVATLGGYYSFRVRVLEMHKMVDYGPYGLVRHPAYAGSILTILGLGLALRSWAAVILLLIFCGVAYGYRINVEEKVMLKELGNEYARYMDRTKRLIPFIV